MVFRSITAVLVEFSGLRALILHNCWAILCFKGLCSLNSRESVLRVFFIFLCSWYGVIGHFALFMHVLQELHNYQYRKEVDDCCFRKFMIF